MSWPEWTAASVYVVPATSEVLTFEYVPSVVPRYSLYPTMSEEVLAVQDRATDSGVTPVPESEIVAGEFVALLATVTVPLSAPGVTGSKATMSVAV
jgi:hypothetical protein